MEVDKYEEGVPSWVDLGTSDIDAAARFYGGLFGWEVPDPPPETGGYRVCMLKGQPVAGLGPQMNPGPPVWATYVNTADADAVDGPGNGQRWPGAGRTDGRAGRRAHGGVQRPERRGVLGVASPRPTRARESSTSRAPFRGPS